MHNCLFIKTALLRVTAVSWGLAHAPAAPIPLQHGWRFETVAANGLPNAPASAGRQGLAQPAPSRHALMADHITRIFGVQSSANRATVWNACFLPHDETPGAQTRP